MGRKRKKGRKKYQPPKIYLPSPSEILRQCEIIRQSWIGKPTRRAPDRSKQYGVRIVHDPLTDGPIDIEDDCVDN